jgi:phosphoenolpyruvate synthase/pyruvate phosphate dikinase
MQEQTIKRKGVNDADHHERAARYPASRRPSLRRPRPGWRQGSPPQQARGRTPGPGGLLPHGRRLQAGSPPGAPLPADLEAELSAAYEALSRSSGIPDVPVAVRSSALDEDGELASFAGQHETELNLVGIDAVLGAVARTWASARNERALAYRRQQGLEIEEVRIAVLVQQLVPADTSAVVFSANPITGNRDEVVVTASWGLGESVVSGTVTPDTWVVRKADLAVGEERIGAKERMTVAVPGGIREVAVPRLLRGRASLNGAQVPELAGLAVQLEEGMGRPVDIEAAFAGDLLYLLQSRPITTLGEPGTNTSAAA